MIKPRLLPSLTIALAVVMGAMLYNTFGPTPEGEDGPTYAIAGRAIANEGTLPSNLWVRISWEEGSGVRSVSVPVGADGAFKAEQLKPGDYRLVPLTRGGDDAALNVKAAAVTIRDRDVTGIEIRL